MSPHPEGVYRGTMRLVPPAKRNAIDGKIIGTANAGRRTPIGVSLEAARHHLHILGPTGTGKSTLLLNMILGDAAAGRGVAVFDPKGDLIRDLLDRLPSSCGNRLILIDPDETDAPPALNLLDAVHGASPHDVAAHVTGVMGQVWQRWWGHRTADVAHHALLTLAHVPGATLAQLPRLLSDTAWRRQIVARVTATAAAADPWQTNTLVEFWSGYEQGTDASRAASVAPLLAKLRLVLANPLASALFGVPASTFRLSDVLRGAILLVRLPKGVVGEDGCRLIGSLLLAGLWQATTARARVAEQRRLDAGIWVDECHNFLHLPIGLDDALAEARGLRVSFALAHQYLDQLPAPMYAAIDANARNKLLFALAPGDARRLQHHVAPWLDASDLTRQAGYEITLRAVTGGKTLPPVTADTLPATPVSPGRAEALREAARNLTGLPYRRRRALLAEQGTGAEPGAAGALRAGAEVGTERSVGVPEPIGRFPNSRPAGSRETSCGGSREPYPGGEPSADISPRAPVYPQLIDDQETE